MRSPFAYIPRRGPLQSASPAAAVAYLGALVVVAFLYSSPLVLTAAGAAAALAGLLAGARSAVRVGLRMGLSLALLIVVVNALVVSRGETVLARLGEWPLLGQVDVTAEAILAGVSIGLRAAAVMVAAAVYSACVDPDRVLRALRPLAGRSALTATLVSRLVPVAAADAARLRDAAQLRGPGAAAAGWSPLLRRLLSGSFDRSVDVAATLELRGYALEGPRRRRFQRPAAARAGRPARAAEPRSRFDGRFYAIAAAILLAAIAGKLLGADDFHTYPTIALALGPVVIALSALLIASGLAPIRRVRPARRSTPAPLFPSGDMHPEGTATGSGEAMARAMRGPAAAPLPEAPDA
jgi:energy-coupling factor transport system permease protein